LIEIDPVRSASDRAFRVEISYPGRLRTLAFHAIDLEQMPAELVRALLGKVMALAMAGEMTPPPYQTFPVGAVSEAFHLMRRAKHVGKIVLLVEGAAAAVEDEGCTFRGTSKISA
jgi:NADPH:quinone reductase-like Zn-dependent oxidoreductase